MTIEDIALQMTPGIGVKGAMHLLEVFGDARSIFAASSEELVDQAELKPELARQLVGKRAFHEAEKELAHCRRHRITVLASTDPDYPPLLREMTDYPHVLYIQGDPEVLASRALSVVGTREMTPYGQQLCNRFIEGLALRLPDLAIVSGLAFGIDSAAHRAALVHNLKTVAVLPCPLPQILPAQHTDLARDILEHGGVLVSELHSQTHQKGTAYHARNRIIAGLSAGCLVVESPASGGSLTTAQQADGYQRIVMAPPGRVTDKSSFGTNNLIRNRTAQLVLTADDILCELGWEHDAPSTRGVATPPTPLTSDEAGLLACFRTSDPLGIETLAQLSGVDPGYLATLLIGLELAGAVRQLPGNCYMRLI